MNKHICTFILASFMAITSYGKHSTYEKLCEVNRCWKDQKDVSTTSVDAPSTLTEHEWIQWHLSFVEKTLRARPTSHLNTEQKANRLQSLDALHQYWLAARFPINEDYNYRTPIFIDKYNNFCAVGYLLRATGFEAVALKIAQQTNLAYVKEMQYPEVNDWANKYGFTIDELAWIQPGYPPTGQCLPIGQGVDGYVKELFVDSAAGRLYVGGSFTNVDSTLTANNIAYVTQSGSRYTWHSMGEGVNGDVNAITTFEGKVFIGGAFSTAGATTATNAAYWDGASWHTAGNEMCDINDLAVFKGKLYACGAAYTCAFSSANFGVWNGSSWTPITGITGEVNTMQVKDTVLYLGGDFYYEGNVVRAIKWSPTTGFETIGTVVPNVVQDFEIINDTLYAACRRISSTDSNLLLKLSGSNWVQGFASNPFAAGFGSNNAHFSINTLWANNNKVSLGGSFHFLPPMGIIANNCYEMTTTDMLPTGDWNVVDSDVHKIVAFNGKLVLGGAFKTGSNGWSGGVRLNGLVVRHIPEASVNDVESELEFTVYPNPAPTGSVVAIKHNFTQGTYALTNALGQVQQTGELNKQHNHFTLPNLATGVYLLRIKNADGVVGVRRICVE